MSDEFIIQPPPLSAEALRMFETYALGQAVGSARLDEKHIGQKGVPVDGGRVRVRLLSRLVPEQVGPPACPILLRWTLLGSSGDRWRLMLHRFPPNSDDRDPHDHPCDFWTLVLAGGYDDLVPGGIRHYRCSGCGFETTDRYLTKRHKCMHRGRYRERSIEVRDELRIGDSMRRGSFRHRRAEHRHRTRAGSGGCWSLVLMAPRRRDWGFWRSGKWHQWRAYERLFGFGMRCD